MSYRHEDAIEIRRLLTLLIRSSVKSREQIAEELSHLLGTTVTRRALDSYTSESAEQHRWPAQYDIALCEVLGDYSLLHERVERAGFKMIGPEEQELLRIGRAYRAKIDAEKILAEVAE